MHSHKITTRFTTMAFEDSSYQKGSSEMHHAAEDTESADNGEGEDTVSLPPFEPQNFESQRYNWRRFSPGGADKSCIKFFRWLMEGGGKFAEPVSDTELDQSLAGLARCLGDLRQYLSSYGMPDEGGPKEQEIVLREVVRDLYAGGAPLWAVDSVMQRASEGLMGESKVNWLILPRKAFVFHPSTTSTSMFKIDRGFDIQRMDDMEKVAIRLASFASNTHGLNNVPTRFPNPREFRRVLRREESARSSRSLMQNAAVKPADELARDILNTASRTQGIFFFVNSKGYADRESAMDEFWVVSDEEKELFTRLATIEALQTIKQIDVSRETLYTPFMIIVFRVVASAGACGFWFNGSWIDMLIAGMLAVIVAAIGSSSVLSKQEKVVFETVASFVVGLTSGLIALNWPDDTCYGAMAIAGVLDILQGFRVVYAIIEVMSKHTVAGGADFLEGLLFTGLIAYFLRFGQYAAAYIMEDNPAETVFEQCSNGIDPFWYIFLVPLAATAWSGLFNPRYKDLFVMGLHGCLAYGSNYGLAQASLSENMNNFVSAALVSLSAGIISRFTGRQAVGNTAAGLYVLLPGAYLVKSLYATEISSDFFSDIIMRAVIIGIGAWSGSILCSPTLLGTTRGLLSQQVSDRSAHGSERDLKPQVASLLLF